MAKEKEIKTNNGKSSNNGRNHVKIIYPEQ